MARTSTVARAGAVISATVHLLGEGTDRLGRTDVGPVLAAVPGRFQVEDRRHSFGQYRDSNPPGVLGRSDGGVREDGADRTVPEIETERLGLKVELVPVFKDGVLLRDQSFSDIRARAAED